MQGSIIAWTDNTANFWMGCAKVSPGCAHCYAETLTINRMGLKVWGTEAKRQPVAGIYANLRKWNRAAAAAQARARVFVMSLGDFFEDHPDANAIRPAAWDAIRECQWLDFQLLTKHPENIPAMVPTGWTAAPWPNVWLGTSIENDRHAFRADVLKQVPAVVHFISAEPLLGPLPSLDLSHIEWVIVGGESGTGYRPMDHAWARELAARCRKKKVAFFFKQSAAPRTEMGIELDGQIQRAYPLTPYDLRPGRRAAGSLF
jgi:protein gp37